MLQPPSLVCNGIPMVVQLSALDRLSLYSTIHNGNIHRINSFSVRAKRNANNFGKEHARAVSFSRVIIGQSVYRNKKQENQHTSSLDDSLDVSRLSFPQR